MSNRLKRTFIVWSNLNEGKFVLNINFIITLKADGLWPFAYMKQLSKTAYNFSVLLILIPFFIILNFLNKKESKVICMREFEIILLETQSLSIKIKAIIINY
jgi:hypothetical protein